MAYGDSPYGAAAYGEAAGGIVNTTVPLAVAVATGLAPTPQGDTVTVRLAFTFAVAQGWSPAASQQAIIAVPVAAATAAGLTPALSGVGVTPPVARSKAVGLSPVWLQLISGGSDSSNALDGRSRGGLATCQVTRPVAPIPAGVVRGTQVTKVIAYPTPAMVKGRPT